ncbi:MAG: serine kinase [Firmicutes bacterium]|nr:serine kinase [Bacillota bacterium]
MNHGVTMRDIVVKLGCEVMAGSEHLDNPVAFGYSSDLLSDVMAKVGLGDVWVTVQTHENIIAVGSITGVSGIIIAGGAAPLPPTVRRANEEGIPLLVTVKPSFEVIGILYHMGIKGRSEK